MNTCVRCGTQFAAGEDRCPFCSLPVAGDADVTRAAPDRSAWQQPGQQPGQPSDQSGGQQWSSQPSGEGPWQQSGQSGQSGPPQGGQPWQTGPPQGGGWQGQQGGQPWQGQPGMQGGMQGGGWQQGPPPGGQPWQQQGGGMPPKKGMNPGLLIGIGVGVLLILGLVAWGLVAAFSGDDDTTTANEGEETSETPSPSASSDSTPTEEASPTESTEASPTEPTEDSGGGGSDTVDFDLSSGSAVVTVTVSSAGRLRLEATSDQTNDIVMVVNDPEGEEVCNEDSTIIFAEECTIQAEVGEYEVVITPYDEDLADPGTGQVRIR